MYNTSDTAPHGAADQMNYECRKGQAAMRYINGDMIDIYNDFFGEGSGPEADQDPKEPIRTGTVRPETGKPDDSKGGSEIEADVITDTELAEQKKAVPAEPLDPEKTGMEELNELIGLKTVKHDVEELIGLAKVRKMREEKGMKAVPISLHLVFSGNPGTGKTTVARILAKLYKEIGILTTGQLIETDRSGLVAGYVGQTAIKTQKKIEEAMGGILFIDEAYTLNQEGENYGQESIDTILKAMEDHRDKFVVIVAGYTELMKDFIESNPGLRSRFNKFFEFPDYTVEELQAIFKMQCKKYQYTMTEEAETAVMNEIVRLESSKGENFANAREVRNLFEKIITNQASRVADLEDVTEETLTLITAEDLVDLEDPVIPNAEESAREIIEMLKGQLEVSLEDDDAAADNEDAPDESAEAVEGAAAEELAD